jgi:fumarate reductase flavoprotein subunit
LVRRKEMADRATGINRRDFVKATALGVGGAAFAGFGAINAMAKVPDKWDEEADVIVVGAGGAGLAAAATIAAAGKSVIVLEKMPVAGGSSLICGGALAFAGTDIQAAEHVKDSNELLYKDLMTVGANVNVPGLVKTYTDNQLETYEWLKKSGVKFQKLGIASGMSVPRAHYVTPADVLKLLSDQAKAKGGKILIGVAATRLVVDEKTGNICGVVAERNKRQIYYGGRRGVILASGGFSYSKDMLARFVPEMTKAQALAGLGSYGDGLKMAWACGADIRDVPYVKATFGFSLKYDSIKDFGLIFYHGALIVNKEGRRFVNESKSYKLVGDAALQQTDAIGIQIFDAAIREDTFKDPLATVEPLEKKNALFTAPTLAELAGKAGIPAAVLEQTVREYNANVDKGVDPQFGRTTLVAAYGKPVKIEKPPFYAFPSTAVVIGTYGGALINEKTQVVDVFGSPIPRLYAAGEVTGGVHGAAYMTGTAFGKALIFGRLAAKNILTVPTTGSDAKERPSG